MSLVSTLKTLIRPLSTNPLGTKLLSIRSRRQCHQLLRQWEMPEVNRLLLQHVGPRSIGGLFPGLVYTERLQPEQMGPFLLGTYELEIAPWFAQCRQRHFSMVLDVGAKFGYYAVGLAQWFPDTPVYAFDTDPWARKVTRDFAQTNHASNVQSLGYCSPDWLNRHLSPNALIVCDCEGFEYELLQLRHSPHLQSATLIVECHDAAPWERTQALQAEFSSTHSSTLASFDPASHPTAVPIPLDFIPSHLRHFAWVEPRHADQRWLFLVPRT